MDSERLQHHIQRALRTAGSVCLVLAVTFVAHILPANALTAGFAYLITILLIAASLGLAESVTASIAATLTLNYYFLPPVGTFTIADRQNWVALFAFLVTSLVASQLSNRAKKRTIEAIRQENEMERLYALSRATMLFDYEQPIGRQIATEIARIYNLASLVLFDRNRDEFHVTGCALPDIELHLRELAFTGSTVRDISGILVMPVTLRGKLIGSMAIKGGALSDASLHALTNLVAISLENSHSRELATRAEAARQSEEFKSTLIDGLAHEFKTPLTSIKAATSALLGTTVSDPGQQGELLTVIDEEVDRLNRLVSEALHIARVEAGTLHLKRRPHSVRMLIEETLRQLESTRDGRSLNVEVDAATPEVPFDLELMQLAIRQVLDNALKYSRSATPITVRAGTQNGNIFIRIHNIGEPLPESERDRIFEKFYRGDGVRNHVPGTGMGLTIAREILRAHGGDLVVDSSADDGTEFTARLPLNPKS